MDQCKPIINDSTLPIVIQITCSNLDTIAIPQESILDIIKSLNVNKAQGPDDISGRLIQLYGLFFLYGFFSSGKRVKSHDSAEKLSRSHSKPESYKKQQKLYGDMITLPLSIIFVNIINTGIFPTLWKSGNVTPIHKKIVSGS